MTIDIGDHVDRFHSISEATNGIGNTKLLNEALSDYVTIGNNEGITLAKEHLNRLYDDAGFEVLMGARNGIRHRPIFARRPDFVKWILEKLYEPGFEPILWLKLWIE